jgi:hypothetical protein
LGSLKKFWNFNLIKDFRKMKNQGTVLGLFQPMALQQWPGPKAETDLRP